MDTAKLLAMLVGLGGGLGLAHGDALPYAARSAPSPTSSVAENCRAGNQALFYSPHPLLDIRIAPGFSDSLQRQLQEPLENLGYCLTEAGDYRILSDTSKSSPHADNLVLQIQANEAQGESGTVLVALLRVRELARGKLAEAFSHPLVSFRFEPGDAASLSNILAKKISENLRSQYVADLLVSSNPVGAYVRTQTGLQSITPVEWVLPLGTVHVTLEKKGYLLLAREIDLSEPGRHAYDLQLSKRRFYHSPFIYPAIASGAVSLAAFALQNHYYDKYQSYGAQDRVNRPEIFGKTFQTAKTFEGIAYTALGLAWLSLTLCITF